jgi:hypothetical protein
LLLTNVLSLVFFLMLRKQTRAVSVSQTAAALTEKKPCQCSGMTKVLEKSIKDHLGELAGLKTDTVSQFADMMNQFEGIKAQLKSMFSSNHVRADTLESTVRKNMEELKTQLQTLPKATAPKPAAVAPGRAAVGSDVANLCRSVMKNQERLIAAVDKLTKVKAPSPTASKMPPKASRR